MIRNRPGEATAPVIFVSRSVCLHERCDMAVTGDDDDELQCAVDNDEDIDADMDNDSCQQLLVTTEQGHIATLADGE